MSKSTKGDAVRGEEVLQAMRAGKDVYLEAFSWGNPRIDHGIQILGTAALRIHSGTRTMLFPLSC